MSSVIPDGEVGSWGWAENAPVAELEHWLDNDVDSDNTQHCAVLVKVGERLKIETQELVDRVFAKEEAANLAAKKNKSQGDSIMDIIRG